MTRVCAVSYLNTKPFLEGLKQAFDPGELAVDLRVPSACAEAFAQGQCELALVPAASLLLLEEPQLLPHYCIGAEGQVDSVYLFSQVPIQEVETLNLDAHSMTSNALARILLRELWQRPVAFTHHDWQQAIGGTTAGVVIGDKAVAAKAQYRYAYDLAAAWQQLTGLPFVFAVWVYEASRISQPMLARILAAFAQGLARRQQVARQWAPRFSLSEEQARHYLEHSISYNLDAAKQQALDLFLQKAKPLMQIGQADR